MFAQPRPKKTLVPPPKKRKAVHAIEEISFNNDARADYLTGFHKRKQARIKHAQEIAAQKARQERIELRKQIREDRKKEVEDHVEKVNTMLREAQNAGRGHAGRSSDDDSDSEEVWAGFADAPPPDEQIDLEAEYLDEDKFTTVTIETVNIDRDGLHKPEDEDSDKDDEGDEPEDGALGEEGRKGHESTKESGSTKKEVKSRPKRKKKKFRYESKAERRLTERRQKSRR